MAFSKVTVIQCHSYWVSKLIFLNKASYLRLTLHRRWCRHSAARSGARRWTWWWADSWRSHTGPEKVSCE